jgi:hypothetical protein
MSLKALNSVGGFSVGNSTITTIIYGNGDVTTGNLIVSNFANLGNVGNVYIGGGANGQVLQTDGSGNLTWSSSANISIIDNGYSNVTIPTANGNIYINANASVDKQWIFDTSGNLTSPYNLLLGNALLVGPDSPGAILNFPNSIFLGTANSSNYAQASLLNKNPNASVDWVAYADNGNAEAGYSDMGMAGSTYNVAGAGLTQPGDGYFVVSGVPGYGGNLVIATSGMGTVNDIVFGNGYDTGNEVMRFFDAGQQFQIHPTTVSTTTSSGALVVSGGVGVGGNLYAGGNVSAGNFTTTGSSGNISGANVIFANSFTSNGGTIDFNTYNPNVQLGNVSNVHIYGGSSGQVLQTDGSGNLSWQATGSPSIIHNGNSNVTIPNADGNVYINANAGTDYNWNFDTSGYLTTSFGGQIVDAYGVGASTGQLMVSDGANYGGGGLAGLNQGGGNNTVYLDDQGLRIYTNTNGVENEWLFDGTGNFTALEGAAAGTTTLGNLVTANHFSTTGTGGDVTLTGGNVTGANVVIANSFTTNAGGTVDFNTNSANVQLGNVGNVHIYGGATGQALITDGSGNLSWTSTANVSEIYNGNSNVTIPTASGNVYINANAGVDQQWVFDTDGNLTGPAAGSANLGNLVIANYAKITSLANTQIPYANATNVLVGTTSLVYDYPNQVLKVGAGGTELGGDSGYGYIQTKTGNFSGNINSLNANLGNLANANILSANYAQVNAIANTQIVYGNAANYLVSNASFTYDDITGNLNVGGNIQTGGGTGGNISGVDYLFANYANFTNDVVVQGNIANANNITVTNNITSNTANITGNLTVGNITGIFANGTSNIAIPTINGNINVSVNGTANVIQVSDTTVLVTGNTITSGNITSNVNFIGNTLTSVGTYLTLASDQLANGTYNINMVPGGAGNVDVNSTYITSVRDPLNPQDAATKQYVDSVGQGLYIHVAANVITTTDLNATYVDGGTTLTVTDIIGNSTIQFSTSHGLSANADISFTNAFNGLSAAPVVYWVDTIPAPNQITVKSTYFGPIVTSLTPGSGLTQPSIAQSGVGATLTNAGTNAPLTIDTILMTPSARVLVTGQTTQAYNGIYSVTTVGDVITPWVLTRSSDGDTFVPQSTTALCSGAYFFISTGLAYGGSSWVLTTPGQIDIGVTNIVFTQFGSAVAYTGANGVAVTGTVISANVDNVTTAIIGGNIAVANSAQLVTPNIGAATGTSLSLTANLLANNVNSNNLVLTDSLTVNTFANVNNFISTGYANVGTELLVGGNANISGNVLVGTGSGGNISGVNYIFANVANITLDALIGGNANITGNVTANGLYGNSLTINNGGNANIAGNLIANNITSNYALTVSNGNVDFTGSPNVALGSNANVHITGGSSGQVLQTDGSGNLNWYSVSASQISNGTSNVSIPIADGNINLVSGGNTTAVITATGANITGYANISGNLSANNANITGYANISGNLSANNANINNVITLGNTSINWATTTTVSITANQTIAQLPVSGVTGVEFFVKGVDSLGTKYSAATVQALTDGTTADFVIYGTTFIGASPGSLSVNIVGANIALQVSPVSTNATVWTTQFRTI